jgi:hypothetical protein
MSRSLCPRAWQRPRASALQLGLGSFRSHPLRHKPLLPWPTDHPIVLVSVSEALRWMTLPRVRRQERADDPAPAPTLSSDLWLPWRVTPLCVCSAAVHCTVNGLASGAPDQWGSPTGNLAPGASVSSSAHQPNSFRARWPRHRALSCSPFPCLTLPSQVVPSASSRDRNAV